TSYSRKSASIFSPLRWGWPAWPKAFQDIDSPEVKAFCVEHEDDVSFYLWLQWLAWSQFAACWETSQRDGMPIGLYRDLAVGVAEHSICQPGRPAP
ncbi:hypothetical protein FK514_28325, partial [Klebsiella pneumoniae]|uniref:4-alpha-glucanotransferase n=1 Tax=Klebsiella pneumoniae TaxID=573 RepID=UPI00210B2A87